jgi:tRNA uridine 5-carbamoylmethylation protein Kti12
VARLSVLNGLQPFSWNSQEAVGYEVALEAIGEAIAVYSSLIQQAQTAGNTQLVDQLRRQRRTCVDDRNQLRSTDREAVARVRREYPALVRRLRGHGW